MSEQTHIQWCDATWNIARGCSKVDADCKYCYMMRDGERLGYDGKIVKRTKTVFNMPLKYKETESKVWPGNPLIFTSSLTDIFHIEIDEFRNEMFDIIRSCPHLTFLLLTKRPERVPDHLPQDWGEGWDNVWFGTSVGSNDSMHRVYELMKIKAKTRFVSFEPLWGAIDTNAHKEVLNKLDWAIIGGESGNDNGKWTYRPCSLTWIDTMVQTFKAANVPVFVKQLGTYLSKDMKLSDRHGGNINDWPLDLQVREFPNVK